MGFLPNTIYHINQKDPANPDYIYNYGCAVCAAGQAAAYYAEKQYTVSDCKEAGLYSEGSASCSWNWNTNKSTNVSVGSTYTEVNSTDVNYATIRDEIDNGHPPIICLTYGEHTHWVMVYAYTSAGDTTSRILVADPADGNKKTLKKAIQYSFTELDQENLDLVEITRIKTTAKKQKILIFSIIIKII